jgi:hypothetical protein
MTFGLCNGFKDYEPSHAYIAPSTQEDLQSICWSMRLKEELGAFDRAPLMQYVLQARHNCSLKLPI